MFFIPKQTKASNGWQPKALSEISQLKFKLTKNCQDGSSSEKLDFDIQKYLKEWGIPIIDREGSNQNHYMNVNITCEPAIENYKSTIFEIEIIQSDNSENKNIEAIIYENQWFGLTHVYFFETEQQIILELLKQFVADWDSVN